MVLTQENAAAIAALFRQALADNPAVAALQRHLAEAAAGADREVRRLRAENALMRASLRRLHAAAHAGRLTPAHTIEVVERALPAAFPAASPEDRT